MRFKVDENLPPEASTFLVEQGHDAVTVWDQQLRGATDPRLAEVCRSEQRVARHFRCRLQRYPAVPAWTVAWIHRAAAGVTGPEACDVGPAASGAVIGHANNGRSTVGGDRDEDPHPRRRGRWPVTVAGRASSRPWRRHGLSASRLPGMTRSGVTTRPLYPPSVTACAQTCTRRRAGRRHPHGRGDACASWTTAWRERRASPAP